jgi:hypothetical protein
LVHALVIVLLLGFFISSASARGGVFVVGSSNEMTEKVQLVSDAHETDKVYGNISVSDGFIDFFVTSPSGGILLCYNKTALESFYFIAHENGTYTMHMVNDYQSENVRVRLSYALDISIVLASSFLAIPYPSNPFDWLELLKTIFTYGTGLGAVAGAIARFLKWLRWKIKYRKSRTPVVINEL